MFFILFVAFLILILCKLSQESIFYFNLLLYTSVSQGLPTIFRSRRDAFLKGAFLSIILINLLRKFLNS